MKSWQPISQELRFSALVLWLLLVSPLTALAGLTEGTPWLSTQQNANGSFGNTAASLATPIQSTAEVLRAYQALGQQSQPGFATALGFLNGDTESNTEFLARKITVNATAGNDITVLVNTLISHQNPDGGFGDRLGDASSTLDTAYALEALAVARVADADVIGAAIYYLSQQQQADGSFRLSDGNVSAVFVSAQALIAMQGHMFQFNLAAPINKVATYLLNRQVMGSGWGEDFETAAALLALVPGV